MKANTPSATETPLTQPGKATEERFLTVKYDKQIFQLIVYNSSKLSWTVKSQTELMRR